MLTYATILIASLVVALFVLFFYKVVSDSSRSVYRSKRPIDIVSGTPGRTKLNHAHKTGIGTPTPLNRKNHAMPPDLAHTVPAMPTETVNWGWKESGNGFRQSHSRQGTGAGKSGHCSLYEVRTAEPADNRNHQTGFLHREEKLQSGGKVYKVTRKVHPKKTNFEPAGKPWGW